MDAASLLPLTTDLLPAGARVQTTDPAVAAALELAGHTAGDGAALGREPVDGVWLLSGEVAEAGGRGPAVIDAAVKRTRPGGLVAVAVRSRAFGSLTRRVDATSRPGAPAPAAMDAATLSHMLLERGVQPCLLAAPGAAANLAGRPWAGADDLELDATPGLLDAGPVILAVARTAPTEADRSRTFFSSIARKVVASSVVCRDDRGHLLIVFDIFRGGWTLPGGLVDASEDPSAAAAREAHEEGGVIVDIGSLLGLFAHDRPDRLHLVYEATPRVATPEPHAVHDHEIAEVRWSPPGEALDLLVGDVARKVRACLDQPGRTWQW